MLQAIQIQSRPVPWNKGKLIGQKPPLKLKEIWAIRIRLQLAGRLSDLALFNLAIDSKLRGCDLVSLRVSDVDHGRNIASRAIVMQQKPSVPSSSRSPNRLASRLPRGEIRPGSLGIDSCSPAECMDLHISRPGSIRDARPHSKDRPVASMDLRAGLTNSKSQFSPAYPACPRFRLGPG